MAEATEQLREAIDRNAPAALTITVDGADRLTRSRLLATTDDGIWLGLPAGQAEAIDHMVRTGQTARVNFKSHQTNVEFRAKVLERRRGYRLNADMLVEAVRLAWPDEISVVQRRAAYRVPVANEDEVSFKVWRIDAGRALREIPPDSAIVSVDVRDFSASGLGGIWKRRRGENPVMSSNQRLRVDVITPTSTLTLEAYVRFLAGLPDPDYRRIGVQFMLNPNNLADRAKTTTLTRITGDLQRAELKRLRIAR